MVLNTIRDKNKHRGPESSKEFNEKFDNIHKDLAYLYDGLSNNEDSIVSNMDINMREKQFMQSRIGELELKIQELMREREEEALEDNRKYLFKSFYDLDGIINNNSEKESSIDSVYGMISPKIIEENSKFSYITSTGEVFLPSGLEVNMKETDDISTLDESTGNLIYRDINAVDTNKIVDRNQTSYWLRTVKYPINESVREVFGECHIKLPTRQLNNIYANTLYINPFPEGSMTISDIFYKGLGEQWDRLPNFPTKLVNGEKIPIPIKNAKKIIFNFPRIEITEIRVFYSQPYWIENNTFKEFSYGFQDIDLSYRNYSEKESEFVSVIDIARYNKYFKYLLYPEHVPAICSEPDLDDLVSHHLYYDENLTTEFEFGEDILAPINKVYIKTILKKQGNRIPVIKNLELKYGEKEEGEY